MNLDLVNKVFNDVKNNKLIQNFIKELQVYLQNNTSKNIKKEENELLSRLL